MNIGFLFIGPALGENIIGFEAFYALKNIYNCKLFVFSNNKMKNLLEYCDFVDLWCPIEKEEINKYHCDYLLLSNSKSYFINLAKSTNAKRIICATKIPSLFSFRCRTVPIYFCKKYYHLSEREILLSFVRRINFKLYDSKIAAIDLNKAKIPTTKEHKDFVLSLIKPKVLDYLGLSNTLEHTPPINLIFINPFNHACPYNLHLDSWIEIANQVSKIPLCIPIIATYPQIHKDFISSVESQHDLSKFIIFQNNENLLNLTSFISQVSCVISPSTGTIHLASNQRIPTIGIYPKYDTRRWATYSKKYIFLDKPLSTINKEQENQVIEQTLSLLKQMLRDNEIKTVFL
ncbi:glycosyltransferase family 9 protein [Helicobacter sp. MIT 14-3879]|uniref:glycosyltransferase family 9 protein n=1 Tax=Helicobacter sp. MIT 14-3879 TaxID=2040649 RepID=UPI000E1EDFF7|nr:glycosyltransferase family 9 protein [Helicobacter sp. MIT 14-3879]RDU60079.1 hypothetical protein CQA44_10885 [Helicobacter sp. MIT 14-3879]